MPMNSASTIRRLPGGDISGAPCSRRTVARASLRALAGLVAVSACALSSGAGFAQTIDQSLWVTNGAVYSVIRDAGTIYIGGEFTQVGPATGAGVPIDAASGALPPSFPKVAGAVYAVVS